MTPVLGHEALSLLKAPAGNGDRAVVPSPLRTGDGEGDPLALSRNLDSCSRSSEEESLLVGVAVT